MSKTSLIFALQKAVLYIFGDSLACFSSNVNVQCNQIKTWPCNLVVVLVLTVHVSLSGHRKCDTPTFLLKKKNRQIVSPCRLPLSNSLWQGAQTESQ